MLHLPRISVSARLRLSRVALTIAVAAGLVFVLGDRVDRLGASPTVAASQPAVINPRDYMADDFWLGLPESYPNVAYLDETFPSEALGRDISYLVVLPPGYETSGQRYPVAYMLHGVGGYRTEWLGYGFVEYARKLMAEGTIRPMIFVFPQGDQSYWVNHADDGARWADYVAYDLVRAVDANYRTIPSREARLIAGLSNGATGALQIGLRNQSVFGAIGAHSPAVRSFDERLPFFGDENWFRSFVDPVSIARLSGGTNQQIMLDIGERDDWFGRAEAVHRAFAEQGIPHRWWTPDGAHDGFYWFYNAAEYLRWYDQVFAAAR